MGICVQSATPAHSKHVRIKTCSDPANGRINAPRWRPHYILTLFWFELFSNIPGFAWECLLLYIISETKQIISHNRVAVGTVRLHKRLRLSTKWSVSLKKPAANVLLTSLPVPAEDTENMKITHNVCIRFYVLFMQTWCDLLSESSFFKNERFIVSMLDFNSCWDWGQPN